ncbi:MAG: hypothetical protein IKR53_05465 [Clostridia bacterium]|nr:hypothetical protein [Clostridia bacterium]
MAKNVLRRPVLKMVVRGYSPEQVDLFIGRAMDRVATLGRENDALRRRLDAALSEIEELKARRICSGMFAEDGAAARDALTGAAETLLGLAAKFDVKEDEPEEVPEEIEAEEPAAQEIAEPEEAVEEVFYEETTDEEAADEEVAAEEVPDGAGEIAEVFYEEEVAEEEAPAVTEPEPEEEEEAFEFVEDLTKDLPEEIETENGIEEAENAVEEAVEEIEEAIPEEIIEEPAPFAETEEIKEETAKEDDDLLAKLRESLTLDGPDFPDDPLANLPDQGGEAQSAGGYEDYSFTELLRGVLGEKSDEAEGAVGVEEAEETPDDAVGVPGDNAEIPAEDAAPSSPDDLDFYDGEEHEDGEDFDPSSLIRRNRPGRDIDKK